MIHRIEAIYCHASETYYYLINGLEKELQFSEEEYGLFVNKLIQQQHPFLRIEGVIFMLPSKEVEVRMRSFDKYGNEIGLCRNGIRCVIKKYHQITRKKRFHVEALNGIVQGKAEGEIYRNVDTYSVYISPILFAYNKKIYINQIIPELSNKLRFSNVYTGCPQLVAKVEKYDEFELFKMGKKINNDFHLFPYGNSLSYYQVLDKQKLFVSTYDREYGLTQSNGSSIAAASIVAAQQGDVRFNRWVSIHNKNGMVKCLPQKSFKKISVKLLGNATFITRDTIVYDSKWHHVDQIINLESFPQEGVGFEFFKKNVRYLHPGNRTVL